MNIFAFFQHSDGRKELVTPSLDSGLILPGVTRRSVLGDFCRIKKKIVKSFFEKIKKSKQTFDFTKK